MIYLLTFVALIVIVGICIKAHLDAGRKAKDYHRKREKEYNRRKSRHDLIDTLDKFNIKISKEKRNWLVMDKLFNVRPL